MGGILTIPRRRAGRIVLGVILGLAALALSRTGDRGLAAMVAAAALVVLASRVAFGVEGRERTGVWWTFLGDPMVALRTVEPASVRQVVVARASGQGRQERTEATYSVRLDGAEPLAIWDESTLLAARRLAEDVARALRCPLLDESEGTPLLRQPEELDASLGERLRARGHPPAVPPLPPASGIVVRRGAETVLELPGASYPPLLKAGALGLPLGMLIVLAVVMRGPVLYLALTVPLLVLGAFAWAFLATSRTSFVTFGREQVELRGHGFVNRIPFAALEEVRCTKEDVVLVSNELVARVPYLFRDESEKRFVAAVVEAAAFHHPAGLPSHLLPVPSSGSEAQVDLQASAVTSLAPQSPPARPRRARRRASPVSPLRTALLLAAGLVILGAASYPTVEAVSFSRRAQVAAGTVIGFKVSRGQGKTLYRPVVRFTTGAGAVRAITGEVASSFQAFEVGEAVEVLYDPDDPAGARLGGGQGLLFGPVILGFLGLAFSCLAFGAALFPYLEARQARRSSEGAGRQRVH